MLRLARLMLPMKQRFRRRLVTGSNSPTDKNTNRAAGRADAALAGQSTSPDASLTADALDLRSFLEAVFVSPPVRVDGTAVFMNAQPGTVPNALLHNLKHNKVLHAQNLFVTVRSHEVPWVPVETAPATA